MKPCARNHGLHGISVVIPILNDDERVKQCLVSLHDQTLSLDLVEIVLVRNFTSDRDSTSPLDNAIQALLDKFSHVQVLLCDPGNSNASNAGIEAARFKFLTIVDCDDLVSAKFLELLLQGIDFDDPTHAVISPIIDLYGIFNRPQIPIIPQRTMQERKNGQRKISVDSNYSELQLFTNQITGKLFHAHVFCEEKFDSGLMVGMDTELNLRLVRSRNVMSVSTSARGCYYFRNFTFPSLSRPTTRDYRFSVTDRISIIKSLVPDFLERDSISNGVITSQRRYIRDYLDLHTDQRGRVKKDFVGAGFTQNFIEELVGTDESTLYP